MKKIGLLLRFNNISHVYCFIIHQCPLQTANFEDFAREGIDKIYVLMTIINYPYP